MAYTAEELVQRRRKWGRESARRRRARDPVGAREAYRRYRKERPDQTREHDRRYRKRHPEKIRLIARRSHLRCCHGITPEDYEQLLQANGGKCWLCGTTSPGKSKHFHIDHNHITNDIRGLLCFDCNVNIVGHMEKHGVTPKMLTNYLKGTKACQVLRKHLSVSRAENS